MILAFIGGMIFMVLLSLGVLFGIMVYESRSWYVEKPKRPFRP